MADKGEEQCKDKVAQLEEQVRRLVDEIGGLQKYVRGLVMTVKELRDEVKQVKGGSATSKVEAAATASDEWEDIEEPDSPLCAPSTVFLQKENKMPFGATLTYPMVPVPPTDKKHEMVYAACAHISKLRKNKESGYNWRFHKAQGCHGLRNSTSGVMGLSRDEAITIGFSQCLLCMTKEQI